MNYRFRVLASGADANAEYMYVTLTDHENLDLDYESPTHPVLQNYKGYVTMGIPSGSGLKLHCFSLNTGHPTFVVFIFQFTDYFLNMICLGVPELFHLPSEIWGLWGVTSALDWYNEPDIILGTSIPCGFYNGYRSDYNSGLFRQNHECSGIYGYRTYYDAFINSLGYMVQKNDYCGKRSFVKPMFYCQDGDDKIFPCGVIPYYFCKWGGLDINEIITYGSQQWRVFPDSSVDQEFGFGLRIA